MKTIRWDAIRNRLATRSRPGKREDALIDFYRGIGGSFHPRAPLLDAMIVAHAAGLPPKEAKQVLFSSTSRAQAMGYTASDDEQGLFLVVPEDGAVVRWIEGVNDMTLEFERFLRDVTAMGMMRHRGVEIGRLLRDVAGDSAILERYLELGRQRKAICVLVAMFLHPKVVQEVEIHDGHDLERLLAEHSGEVWISGRCLMIAVEQVLVRGLP